MHGTGMWIGNVSCSFDSTSGGNTASNLDDVIGGSASLPVIYSEAQAYSSGGTMTVMASVGEYLTSTLSCVESNPGGDLPQITVFVRSAMALSVNEVDVNYGGFGFPGG